jgi:exosome complex exonuclease DIS3/RRP44
VLEEHGIPHGPFSRAVEACLPKLPYEIPAEDLVGRTDFRPLLVCSVDPPGCTDIDDALHSRPLPDGSWEVGVHIADVSHYVKTETALDEEAAKRGTSVYLADRRIDMIPTVLSSNICSLHPNTEKLVFSVVWKLSADAKILETEFHKGVIKSRAGLTYAEAQARLNSDSNDPITLSLKGLSGLAQILKRRRFENGALMLSAAEVSLEHVLQTPTI